MQINDIQYLQFKQMFRSQRMGTGIAAKIFMGFFILYFGAIFLSLGFFYAEIMDESPIEGDIISNLHKYLFYYLIFELVMRVIFQEVSEVQYRHLSLQPIKKSKIVQFILFGSAISIFNLLPLFFVIPVGIKTLMPLYGVAPAIAWMVAVFLLLLFNNYIALQLKQLVSGNPMFYALIAGAAGLIYFVDSQSWLPISAQFDAGLRAVLVYTWPVIAYVGLALLAYFTVFKRMVSQAYVSGNLKKKQSFLEKLDFSGLSDRGFFGLVAQLNLQLMFRNKRIRTQVIFGAIFLLYGLYLYSDEKYGPTFLLFWGLYMTGIIVLSFAQYIWSYQGSYFELLNTMPMSIKKYLHAQYNFLILACLVTGIPSMLYYFMNPDIPKINLAALLFNIGVNIPILLAAAVYNKKKLEVNTAGTFNMQGISGAQFLFIFLVLLLPVFIYLPFSIFGFTDLGLLVVGGLGVSGLLFKPLIVKGLAALFKEKKYSLTEGYRS